MLLTANIFQPLMTAFETVLKFFHNTGGISWGWSIVLLTVCIRVVLVPLAIKQYHSMRGMQQLAPQMKEIQRKYKEDKQRQQQEMMRLYKEHNVNPFASCLPLVLQLPVLISLYYMLRESLRGAICPVVQRAFRHSYAAAHHITLHAAAGQTRACGSTPASHFLFIPDLTAKATGGVLIALIVLYVGTQVLSQLLMATPQMDKTQQRMMMLLPLVFIIFIINFPTGVIVYWITTNLWTITQQYVIRKRLGPPTPAVAGAPGGAAAAAAGKGASGKPAGAPAGEGAAAAKPSRRARLGVAARAGEAATEKESPDGGAAGRRGGRGGPDASGQAAPAASNGDGEGAASGTMGAIVGALRKRRDPELERVSAAARRAAPPPPPRKKKKRSGRRR